MSDSQNPWATDNTSNDTDSAASDPWGSTESNTDSTASDASASNPWGAEPDNQSTANMLSANTHDTEASFSLMDPFQEAWIPLESWVETFVTWLVANFRPMFSAIKAPIDLTLGSIESVLQGIPALAIITIFGLLGWQLANKRLGGAIIASLFVIGGIGAWSQAMTTLSLVITSVLYCLIIGIPTGIWMGRNDTANKVIRPILDAMQTTPAFVYLVPIVMLLGIGNVPGVVVTIIFSVPPVIRLTNLGIRQVPEDLIEAAHAFGASPTQMLFKVQLPLAMRTIMAGVNQTLMLCLSMVVIASMISVGGLGLMVLRGIGRLDIGLATVGGVAIVILAIMLDRLTQALGEDRRARGVRHWYQQGPIGLLLKFKRK